SARAVVSFMACSVSGLSAGVASAGCSASPGGGASLRLVSFDKFSFALIIFKVAAKYTNPWSRATALKNPGGETTDSPRLNRGDREMGIPKDSKARRGIPTASGGAAAPGRASAIQGATAELVAIAHEFVVCPSVSFTPMFASGTVTNVLNLSNDSAVYRNSRRPQTRVK